MVAVDRAGLAMSGPLAPEFSALTSVTSINVEENALSGTLPPQWSTLTNAIRVFGYNNQIGGTLPTGTDPIAPGEEGRDRV